MGVMKYDVSEFPTEFNNDNFKVVGTGGFGEVRVCYHTLLGRVALKLFRITGSNEEIQNAKKEFENEAKILQRIKHPHIVTFYGVTSLFGREGLVMEFMEGGNLDDLITQNILSWTGRLRLLHELISAISYLHNHDKKKAFIHGDIKPQNILLTTSRVLKLADFGSVNIRQQTGVSQTTFEIPHSTQHTWPFTAPEFLKDLFADKTPTMDIYSYGIIVYEVLTRIRAYSDSAAGRDNIVAAIGNGTRPNQSKLDEVDKQFKQHQKQDHDIFLRLQSLMKKCWQQEPTKRPKATKILETITQQMDELAAMKSLVLETTTTTLVDEVPDIETINTERLDHASYNETFGQQLNAIDLPESAFMIVGGWNTNKLVQIYDINRKSFKPLKVGLLQDKHTRAEFWGMRSAPML
uniref:receptor-interacting serine/threonine-protein kinase 1-like isoform X2 n=1 Tax=Ciona intestinalis TaxID=7719 RepID=UPI000EF5336C|nr:receptor-interacting serine/threonine-protein kinase 1-like isoform X2 [Ciona intestinalis]|eukprot:XP_026695383.1 receptor-interacting serine/threonine-protein kinase 1-like isoform X2 [Ciona intestinalis]